LGSNKSRESGPVLGSHRAVGSHNCPVLATLGLGPPQVMLFYRACDRTGTGRPASRLPRSGLGAFRRRNTPMLGNVTSNGPGLLLAAEVSLAASGPLLAQDQPSGEPAALQEVVVTGSRIAAPNEQSPSPIEVLSTQSIQATGRNDISDV